MPGPSAALWFPRCGMCVCFVWWFQDLGHLLKMVCGWLLMSSNCNMQMFQPASPNGLFDLHVKQDQWENITIVYGVIKIWSAAGFKNSRSSSRGSKRRPWHKRRSHKRFVFSRWTKDRRDLLQACSASLPSHLPSKTANLADRHTVTDRDKNQGRQRLKAQTDCVNTPRPLPPPSA